MMDDKHGQLKKSNYMITIHGYEFCKICDIVKQVNDMKDDEGINEWMTNTKYDDEGYCHRPHCLGCHSDIQLDFREEFPEIVKHYNKARIRLYTRKDLAGGKTIRELQMENRERKEEEEIKKLHKTRENHDH
jgi:hypothetical protein|tara:strand:- start:94 stop:489 length:396 start_codon:yes stop_codon:yes gene_type:complete